MSRSKMRFAVLVSGLVAAASPAASQDPLTSRPDCGGDAFSSAQVIEHRPPRHGPVTAVPDTLCADLAPQQPAARVDIYANPILLPENGARARPDPYGGRPPRSGGPPRP